MSSKSRQKQPNFKGISASDAEIKYKRKYKELKKKIRDMEDENEKLTLKLTKAKKNIQRLRIERSFLFDRLEQSQPTNESDSEQSSSPQRALDSEEEISSSQEGLLEEQGSSKRRRQGRDSSAPKDTRKARENRNKDFTRILNQDCGVLSIGEKGKEKSTRVDTSLTRPIDPDVNHQHKCGEKNLSPPIQAVAATDTIETPSNRSDHNGRNEQSIDKDFGSDFDTKEAIKDDRIMDDDELVSGSEEMIDELASDNGGFSNSLRHSHSMDEIEGDYNDDKEEKETGSRDMSLEP